MADVQVKVTPDATAIGVFVWIDWKKGMPPIRLVGNKATVSVAPGFHTFNMVVAGPKGANSGAALTSGDSPLVTIPSASCTVPDGSNSEDVSAPFNV